MTETLRTAPLRAPCKCGETLGRVVDVNGQDTVRCVSCNVFAYNQPRTESGRAVRTATTVHNGIKPKLRAKILERDNCRCLCGQTSSPLHVGHIVSVDAGMAAGLTDAEINDEENLVTMCVECNLGFGAQPLSLRLAIVILRARISWRDREAGK